MSQDNGRAGIGGTSVHDGLMQNCISRRNNRKGDGNGGGGKFTRSDGLVVDGYQSYDNTGVGLWFDYMNINVVVKNCEIHDNVNFYTSSGKLKSGAAGIFFEISGVRVASVGSPTITKSGTILAENNHVWNNQEQGIQVWATANVTLRNNVVENNDKAQIMLRAAREKPFETRNCVVTGNTLKGKGAITIQDTVSYTESNNTKSA